EASLDLTFVKTDFFSSKTSLRLNRVNRAMEIAKKLGSDIAFDGGRETSEGLGRRRGDISVPSDDLGHAACTHVARGLRTLAVAPRLRKLRHARRYSVLHPAA